jgi:hypothetical protein
VVAERDPEGRTRDVEIAGRGLLCPQNAVLDTGAVSGPNSTNCEVCSRRRSSYRDGAGVPPIWPGP